MDSSGREREREESEKEERDKHETEDVTNNTAKTNGLMKRRDVFEEKKRRHTDTVARG